MYKITVVAGDGTGPEVMAEAKKVLNKTADVFNIKFEFNDYLIGGIAYEKFGTPLPDVTVKAAKDSDAVMLGAVGDWKYDTLPPEVRPEKALLGIRKELNLCKSSPCNCLGRTCFKFTFETRNCFRR